MYSAHSVHNLNEFMPVATDRPIVFHSAQSIFKSTFDEPGGACGVTNGSNVD